MNFIKREATTWFLLAVAAIFSLPDTSLTDTICGILIAAAIISGIASGVATGKGLLHD